jgi:hypothetical protein
LSQVGAVPHTAHSASRRNRAYFAGNYPLAVSNGMYVSEHRG